jgi:hypothetical protein
MNACSGTSKHQGFCHRLRDFAVLCFAKPEAFAERFGGIRLALVPRWLGKKQDDG